VSIDKMIEAGTELVPVEPGEVDTLKDAFRRQTELMQALKAGDKLPEWPIDLTSKYGQRLIKELIWAMVEEMAEASFILKNRSHRFTDHTDVDFAHFKEELADAFSYFIEICVYAGIDHDELFKEYCRKNYVVKKRVQDGY
jgi:NTP pyrophosphatase (non-canonical NTP hydrolase)